LLVTSSGPTTVDWPETTTTNNNALYKNLILVTVVLMNLSMANTYVMDVNLWNAFFVVVAYAVMDTTFRRTNELLHMSSQVDAKFSKTLGQSGFTLFGLGALLRFGLLLLGISWLFWEFNRSPQYSSYLVAKQKDTITELDHKGNYYSFSVYLMACTIIIWALMLVVDVFTDYQHVFFGKSSLKYIRMAQAILYFLTVCLLLVFVIPTLLWSTPATTWKEYTANVVKDSFTAYEWDRNNWIYGISRVSENNN
jgi:hypothetical protein